MHDTDSPRPRFVGAAAAVLVLLSIHAVPAQSEAIPGRSAGKLVSLRLLDQGTQLSLRGAALTAATRTNLSSRVIDALGSGGALLASVTVVSGPPSGVSVEDESGLAIRPPIALVHSSADRVSSAEPRPQQSPTVTWEGLDGNVSEFRLAENVSLELGGRVLSVTQPNGPPDGHGGVPVEFALLPNSPNPFGHGTTLRFALPKEGHVKLSIFDLQGRCVATVLDEIRQPGTHAVQYRNARLSAGRYEVRLLFSASDGSMTKQSVRPIVSL